MSSLLRRLERLEQMQAPKDTLTVFIYRWGRYARIARATCNDSELLRDEGETEDAFMARCTQWAKSLPGQSWGRAVWLHQED